MSFESSVLTFDFYHWQFKKLLQKIMNSNKRYMTIILTPLTINLNLTLTSKITAIIICCIIIKHVPGVFWHRSLNSVTMDNMIASLND